jgi:hypothetical protein
MTETSRFHDVTSNTDVHFAETFRTVHLDGVDLAALNGLKITQNSPQAMNVLMDTGIAWVQGRWYKNDASKTISFDAADATYTRYDRIVLRSTAAGSPGTVRVAVVKGTAAASPSLPALTQTVDTVWEIPIAYVTIAAGTTQITTAMITDQRENMSSSAISYVIDNGGAAIGTGSKGYIQIPYDCKVLGWTVIGDQSGSIVVDIKAVTVSSWPASSLTTASIAGTDKPTLSSKKAARSFALTGWTTAVTEGDIWEFYVDSASTVTRVSIMILVARTN